MLGLAVDGDVGAVENLVYAVAGVRLAIRGHGPLPIEVGRACAPPSAALADAAEFVVPAAPSSVGAATAEA